MKSNAFTESPKSERLHRKLEGLARELGVPIPFGFVELEVTMPDGKIVHHHKQRMHSWVRNAYNSMFQNICVANASGAFGAGATAMKDTGGTTRTASHPILLTPSGGRSDSTGQNYDGEGDSTNQSMGYGANAGDAGKGIIVGSGANAESFEDYALQTPIANGSGAGRLDYSTQKAPVTSYDVGTKTLTRTMVRFVNNNSGGDIDVNEIALYAQTFTNITSNSKGTFCGERTHLGATITIPDTGQLKVTYTMSLVYPA